MELKPCPFCGGNVIRCARMDGKTKLHSYECDGWGCEIKPSTKEYESAAVARQIWNKRKS